MNHLERPVSHTLAIGVRKSLPSTICGPAPKRDWSYERTAFVKGDGYVMLASTLYCGMHRPSDKMLRPDACCPPRGRRVAVIERFTQAGCCERARETHLGAHLTYEKNEKELQPPKRDASSSEGWSHPEPIRLAQLAGGCHTSYSPLLGQSVVVFPRDAMRLPGEFESGGMLKTASIVQRHIE